jgi:hypothetical protein
LWREYEASPVRTREPRSVLPSMDHSAVCPRRRGVVRSGAALLALKLELEFES